MEMEVPTGIQFVLVKSELVKRVKLVNADDHESVSPFESGGLMVTAENGDFSQKKVISSRKRHFLAENGKFSRKTGFSVRKRHFLAANGVFSQKTGISGGERRLSVVERRFPAANGNFQRRTTISRQRTPFSSSLSLERLLSAQFRKRNVHKQIGGNLF